MTTRTRSLRRFALMFLCASSLLAAVGTPNASAVVGGKPADPAAFPFLAVVGGGCGGALIAPDRVLTAAHCREVLAEKRFVRVGPKREKRAVRRIAIHPVNLRSIVTSKTDAGAAEADFMVLELDRPVLDVEPLEIGQAPVPAGTAAVTVGRGTTDPGKPPDGRLRRGEVVVQADSACRDELSTKAFRTWFTCVRDPRSLDRKQKGPFVSGCFGDSGSPLLVRQGLKWVSVGVDSWGPACGTERDPEIYADAVAGRDFALSPTPVWAPAPASSPVISGAARVGRTVTCAVTWITAPKRAVYEWRVGKRYLASGKSPKYTIPSSARGKKLSCVVVGRGKGGTDVSSSAPVRVSG